MRQQPRESVMLNRPTSCRSQNISASTWKNPLNKIMFLLLLWHGAWVCSVQRPSCCAWGLKCIHLADLGHIGSAGAAQRGAEIALPLGQNWFQFQCFSCNVTAASGGPGSAIYLSAPSTVELMAPVAREKHAAASGWPFNRRVRRTMDTNAL